MGVDEEVVTTFVVGLDGVMAVANRHSEHVACAGLQPVLAVGEVTFSREKDGSEVIVVSNRSTGYCPDLARCRRRAGSGGARAARRADERVCVPAVCEV